MGFLIYDANIGSPFFLWLLGTLNESRNGKTPYPMSYYQEKMKTKKIRKNSSKSVSKSFYMFSQPNSRILYLLGKMATSIQPTAAWPIFRPSPPPTCVADSPARHILHDPQTTSLRILSLRQPSDSEPLSDLTPPLVVLPALPLLISVRLGPSIPWRLCGLDSPPCLLARIRVHNAIIFM